MQGGGILVLKENLKKLKGNIKRRNKDIFGNFNQVGEDLQKKINELD